MNLSDDLTSDEISLIARAVSIHRHALRRKLGRVPARSAEYQRTVIEMAETDAVIAKFNEADLQRISAA